jgi:hypothetical protein
MLAGLLSGPVKRVSNFTEKRGRAGCPRLEAGWVKQRAMKFLPQSQREACQSAVWSTLLTCFLSMSHPNGNEPRIMGGWSEEDRWDRVEDGRC